MIEEMGNIADKSDEELYDIITKGEDNLIDKILVSLDIDTSEDLNKHESASLIQSMISIIDDIKSAASAEEREAIEKNMGKDRETVVQDMFDSFDENRDGKLSRDELRPVFFELLKGVRDKAKKSNEKLKNEWKEEVD
jgi:Ca2+-binding EF-hand superfamily protein